MRQGPYAMLPDAEREYGHKRAAVWLEQAGEGDARVLAEHFERGGEPLRAAGLYQRAAEQALRGQDCAAASDLAERGIRCGATGEVYIGLVGLVAEGLVQNGDSPQGLLRYDEILALASPGSRAWCWALAGKLFAAFTLGVTRPVMEVIGAIQAVEPETDAAVTFASSLALICWTLMRIGQFELSEVLAARMERLGGPLMDQEPWLRGWIETVRAERSRYQGDMWKASCLHQRGAASYAEAGELRMRSVSRSLGGISLVLLGAHAEGEQILEEVVKGDEASPLAVASTMPFLALVKAERGALDEALADATALVSAALVSQRGSLNHLRLLLAQIQLRRGDLEAAEREALAAFDLFTLRPRDRARTLTTLADIRLEQRRPAEALAYVEQALGEQQAIPPAYRAGAYLPLMHAEALFATGDHEGARAVLLAARRDLLERADRIGDPAMRERFLGAVPENARLLSRAREWLGELAAASV